MTSEQYRSIIQQAAEAWIKGDADAFASLTDRILVNQGIHSRVSSLFIQENISCILLQNENCCPTR